MKKILFSIAIASFVLFSCNANDAAESTGEAGETKASKADTSYAFGMVLGKSVGEIDVELDYNAFLDGFKASIEGKETRLTEEEAIAKIQAAVTVSMAQKAEENQKIEDEYFSANGQKEGVVTTDSGLQYEVITKAEGAVPTADSVVKVHYVGTFTDGNTFDSSIERGEPAIFPLNQVIPGWSEGIQLMNVGSKYRLYIPSNLGYGEAGAGDFIPPFSSLIFEVELLGIEE